MAGSSGRSQSLSGLGTALSLGSLAAAPFSGGASLALGAGALGAGTGGSILSSNDAAEQANANSDQDYLDNQMNANIEAAQQAAQPRQQAQEMLSQYVPQVSMGALGISSPENPEVLY
jgi:hypothetical protein